VGKSTVVLGVLVAIAVMHQSASLIAEEIAWSSDLRSAWKSSQETDRPILLFVTSKHCSYCRKMQSDTLASAAVKRSVHDSYIPVMLDAEKSAGLANQLKVSAVPTTILMLPDGRIADRVDGYVSAAKLQARLESVVRERGER